MDSVIKNSLKNSMTYEEYRGLIKQLVEQNSNSGNEKTEALVNYTKVNDRRMNRWDKTLKLTPEVQKAISKLKDQVTWLVITESWCGDAAHVLPVINKVVGLNTNIDLKIILRDENEDLMNQYLTNGSRSIPKLIILNDDTGEVIDTYGPRPSELTKLVDEFKEEHGALTSEFKEDLQRWFNLDKGQNIIEDLTQLMCELEPSICL